MKPSLTITGVVIAGIGVILFMLWLQKRYQDQFDSLQSVINEQNSVITYWKTEAGKTVSSKPAAEILPKDLEHYPEIMKELKDLKIENREIKALLHARIQASGQGTVPITPDTTNEPASNPVGLFSIDDGYLQLDGTATTLEGSLYQSLKYKYTYVDTLLSVIHTKKKWLFGNERLYGDFRLSNPNARAVSQTSLLLRKREKRFVIAAGVNYSIDGKLLPGVHVGFALLKL